MGSTFHSTRPTRMPNHLHNRGITGFSIGLTITAVVAGSITGWSGPIGFIGGVVLLLMALTVIFLMFALIAKWCDTKLSTSPPLNRSPQTSKLAEALNIKAASNTTEAPFNNDRSRPSLLADNSAGYRP